MSIKPLPVLEPLVNDINSQYVGYFLKTNYFKKLMIKQKFENTWISTYENVKKNRNYLALSLDHEPFDCLDAFVAILNSAYQQDKKLFYSFVNLVIIEFHYWEEKEIKLPFKDLIEDYEMLDFPHQYMAQLKELQQEESVTGPISTVPEEVWNGEKLKGTLKKMDISISKGEYNLTLTYCYSALEGLFKTFIREKNITAPNTDQLPKLAGVVRDHLRNEFESQGKEVPELILNLIPTITNAIANARNTHSDSHFDKIAEKWMAEFSKDCVHSIGRLVVNFLK